MGDGVLPTARECASAFSLFGGLLCGASCGFAGLTFSGKSVKDFLQAFRTLAIVGGRCARPYRHAFCVNLLGPVAEMNVAVGIFPFEYLPCLGRATGLS